MDLLLRTIRGLVSLSIEEEEVVRRLFVRKAFQKGEHLLEAGRVCRHIYFVETGLVRYYLTKDGEERTNYFNREGEFVCNYVSFLPQTPSLVYIQALEPTVVWMTGFEDMQVFYASVAQGERFGRLAIEQVFVNVAAQVTSLYTEPPEVRYSRFLSQFPAIVQRVPQYYIATYVGIKPQSLSRIRKRMTGGA